MNPIPADNNVNPIHIYMLIILESWLSIVSSHLYHTSLGHEFCSKWSEPFDCSTWTGPTACAQDAHVICIYFHSSKETGSLDWMSERVLNWHFWFSWLVGVTTPPAHSPAYVQIVKQNWVKKLMDVTPCHLPFLSIFLLARGVVTLQAKESVVYALRFSLRRI